VLRLGNFFFPTLRQRPSVNSCAGPALFFIPFLSVAFSPQDGGQLVTTPLSLWVPTISFPLPHRPWPFSSPTDSLSSGVFPFVVIPFPLPSLCPWLCHGLYVLLLHPHPASIPPSELRPPSPPPTWPDRVPLRKRTSLSFAPWLIFRTTYLLWGVFFARYVFYLFSQLNTFVVAAFEL